MEKLLLTRKEAADALNDADTLDEIHKAGYIRCVRIGARVYYTPEELKSYITKEICNYAE